LAIELDRAARQIRARAFDPSIELDRARQIRARAFDPSIELARAAREAGQQGMAKPASLAARFASIPNPCPALAELEQVLAPITRVQDLVEVRPSPEPRPDLFELAAATRRAERRQLAEDIARAVSRRQGRAPVPVRLVVGPAPTHAEASQAAEPARRRALAQHALMKTPRGRQALNSLTRRERSVVPYIDKTPSEIGRLLGISRDAARKARDRVRGKLGIRSGVR
jgi:hypothetical protein